MRKKDDSLRGALIDYARELAEKEGPEAVNIRLWPGKPGLRRARYIIIFHVKTKSSWLTEEY